MNRCMRLEPLLGEKREKPLLPSLKIVPVALIPKCYEPRQLVRRPVTEFARKNRSNVGLDLRPRPVAYKEARTLVYEYATIGDGDPIDKFME